jgi:N-methylhydantoinase B
MDAGDSFVMRASGGGGYGDPRDRPRDLVLADLAAGFISPEALTAYGVTDAAVAGSTDAATDA